MVTYYNNIVSTPNMINATLSTATGTGGNSHRSKLTHAWNLLESGVLFRRKIWLLKLWTRQFFTRSMIAWLAEAMSSCQVSQKA